MKNFILKELRLSTPALSFIFLSFALMTFIPGYPILCGGFFICLGLFQGYQYSREAGDIMYSLLLPVGKRDIVRGKFLAAVILEAIGFILSATVTALRMTVLAQLPVYKANALMPANPVFLAFLLLIFTAFNVFFIGGFFRTAYKLTGPFISFAVAAFVMIGLGETLHHLPGLDFLGEIRGDTRQYIILAAAFLCYIIGSFLACRRTERSFESLDF